MMSDEEIPTESDQDFSAASEDEWMPNKSKKTASSDSYDSDFEESSSSPVKQNQKTRTKAKLTSSKSAAPTRKPAAALSASLRKKLYEKYKKPATEADYFELKINTSLSTVLENSKYKKKKEITQKNANESSDSESSGDDYMVHPNKLDLNSDFFKPQTEPTEPQTEIEKLPNFDCNVGVALSDSGSDSEDENEEGRKPEHQKITSKFQSINSASSNKVDFRKMHAFAKQLEHDKEHLLNYKSKASQGNDDVNVSDLLAMGEPSWQQAPITANEIVAKKMHSDKHSKKKRRKDSETDWEDVHEQERPATPPYKRPTQDVEIRLDLPNELRKSKNSKEVDLEACLKRKLNRIKKEHQVSLHKVNVLCWIAHGNYVNNVCNNPQLMEKMLKMIPSTNCYPTDKTSLNYFDQIMKWYTLVMCLAKENEDQMYSTVKRRPNLPMSLALQMHQKKAICKRDYVLMFVLLLRALGIQCRMVMSLNTIPLRPAQHELCRISAKKEDENAGESKIPKRKRSTDKKKAPTITVKSPAAESSKNSKKVPEKNDRKPEKSTAKTSRSSADERQKSNSRSKSSDKPKSSKAAEASLKPELRTTRARSKSIEKGASSSKTTGKSNDGSKHLAAEPRVTRARSKSIERESSTKADVLIPSSSKTTEKSSNKLAPEPRTTRARSKSIEKAVKTKQTGQPAAKEQLPARETRSRSKTPSLKEKIAKTTSKATAKKTEEPKVKMSGKLRLLQNVPQLDGGDDLKKSSSSQPPNLANLKRKINAENGTKVVAAKDKLTDSPRTPFADSTEAKNKNGITKANENEPSPRKTRRQRVNEHKSLPVPGSNKKRRLANIDDLKSPKVVASPSSSQKDVKAKTPDLSKLKPTRSSDAASSSSKKTTSKSKASLIIQKPAKKLKRKKSKSISVSDDTSDDDFQPKKAKISAPPHRKRNPVAKSNSSPTFAEASNKLKKLDKRVLSTDDDDDNDGTKKKKQGMDVWVEVYSEIDKKWFTVDLFKGKEGMVNCLDHICRQASHPMIYVFAWNNDGTIKDISARYCTNFNTTVRKMRAEREWMDTALAQFKGKKTARDKKEDQELDQLQYDKPMPTAISEFKDHPLYALQRHLLKFQAIYPPNPPPLGYVRNEPIYARECVYTLHSRELWLKQARTVKLNEKPYKVVMARPKWDRLTGKVTKDIPLEIFGFWQTEQYDPPTAENGVVPRNAYGNVELFKACMLPKKTVHLQLPGLNKTCRRLNIDCASAVVGFDFHGGWSHPVYDGFVICEEFMDQVVDAWNRDQEEQERKDREKYEIRVYGNWKKLIKGLFIRKRLQTKYNFGVEQDKDEEMLVVEKVPMVPAAATAATKRRPKKFYK